MKRACEDIRWRLKAWIDGELSAAECRAVENHVAHCAQCDRWAVDFRLLGKALREASVTAELSSPPQARAQAATVLLRAERARRLEERTVKMLQRAAAVAAAVLILTVALQFVWWPGGGGEQLPVATADEALEVFLSGPEPAPEIQLAGDFWHE